MRSSLNISIRAAKLIKMISVVAAASLFSMGSAARAQILVVNTNNLDTGVTHESTASSQTEGVKNGTNENVDGGTNNSPGTMIGSDPGAHAYWQGFQTGSNAGGDISLLTLDLTVLASPAGTNTTVSNADTETFYLYSFKNGNIATAAQIGSAIATVTAAKIESGTPVGYVANGGSDIYQYNLISSLSTYDLAANTDYAIVMMTSSGSQDVGWAESNTKATGDMGELDKLNTGGNNGGAYGQMELEISSSQAVPEPSGWTLGFIVIALLGVLRLRAMRA